MEAGNGNLKPIVNVQPPPPPEMVCTIVVLRTKDGDQRHFQAFIRSNGENEAEDTAILQVAAQVAKQAMEQKMRRIVPVGAMPAIPPNFRRRM